MHFGRGKPIVDTPYLAPDPVIFCESKSEERQSEVRLGLPSWADVQWKHVIYPKGLKKAEYLAYYAQKFGFVELNASFYGSFSATQYEKWASAVCNDFVFLPKIPSLISHRKRLKGSVNALNDFINTLSLGNSNITTVFIQLPENFTIDSLPIFENFIQHFPPTHTLLIEFRHTSWFAQNQIVEYVAKLLFHYKCGTVITDAQGAPYVLHSTITSPYVLLRFQSEDAADCDAQRINRWADIISCLLNERPLQCCISLHQPDPAKIPPLLTLWQKTLVAKNIWSPEEAHF
jgi:uncharacterized protein YecE (DUF72 family)